MRGLAAVQALFDKREVIDCSLDVDGLAGGPVKAECIDMLAEVLLDKGSAVPFRITGGSMSPTINVGEWVLVRKAGASDLSIGDIALIRSGDSFVTHRFFGPVGKSSGDHVWHKGDRGRRFDTVPAERIIGKVTGIRKPGGSWIKLDGPIWRLANRMVGLYHYTLVYAGRCLAFAPAPREKVFNALVRIPNGLVSMISEMKGGGRG